MKKENYISIKDYLVIVSIFLILYFWGFITKDFYYVDDLIRSVDGNYFEWSSHARPFSEYIYRFIYGENVYDIFPVTLFLGIGLFIYVLYRFDILFNKNKYQIILLPLLMLTSPFLLENVSFHFDILTMLISMSLAIIASSFNLNKINSYYFIFSIAILFSIWSMYQPSIHLYLCFLSINVISRYINNKKFSKIIIVNIISFLISYILYLIIYKTSITNDYALYHIKLIELDQNGFNTIVRNIDYFTTLIISVLTSPTCISYIFVAIMGGIAAFVIDNRMRHQSNYNRLLGYGLLFSPFIVIILSFILYLPLEHPTFKPRVLVGISGVLAYLFFLSWEAFNKKLVTFAFIFVLLSNYFTASAYTNAISRQYDFYIDTVHDIGRDLSDIENNISLLYIVGDLKRTPVIRSAIKNHPYFDIQIREYFKYGYLIKQKVYPSTYLFKLDPLTENLNIEYLKDYQFNGEENLLSKNNNYQMYSISSDSAVIIFQ
ncbi:glucosyltransferase domain-containing protein [Vibrio sp. RC27]